PPWPDLEQFDGSSVEPEREVDLIAQMLRWPALLNEGGDLVLDTLSLDLVYRHVCRLTFRAERLRPARYSCKIAYQRGGPKSAPAPSWAAAGATPRIRVPAKRRCQPSEVVHRRRDLPEVPTTAALQK